MSDVSQKVKLYSVDELLTNYEHFDGLIQQIFNFYEHHNFCKRTRLFQNVVFVMFQDLVQIYKAFYILVTEILERFPNLALDQAKKAFVVYQNFVTFTDIMKTKVDKIKIEFNFAYI